MLRTPPSRVSQPNILSSCEISEISKTRPYNNIRIVVTNTITKKDLEQRTPQENLIQLTDRLAAEAKNGTLKGIGGFASYDDGYYMLGLSGSYLLDPSSAVLPIERLKHQIMLQLED